VDLFHIPVIKGYQNKESPRRCICYKHLVSAIDKPHPTGVQAPSKLNH
tara:strand:+ start:290 stop:433 length:144 start_codon:yes stop_codon:yes gene_type:complete